MKRKKKSVSKKRTRKTQNKREAIPIVPYPDLTETVLCALKLLELSGFGVCLNVESKGAQDSRGRMHVYGWAVKFNVMGIFRPEQINFRKLNDQIVGIK